MYTFSTTELRAISLFRRIKRNRFLIYSIVTTLHIVCNVQTLHTYIVRYIRYMSYIENKTWNDYHWFLKNADKIGNACLGFNHLYSHSQIDIPYLPLLKQKTAKYVQSNYKTSFLQFSASLQVKILINETYFPVWSLRTKQNTINFNKIP